MASNTKKAKKAFGFNLIDVIVLLALLAVIFGIVYYFFMRDEKSGEESFVLEYVIETKELPDEFSGYVKKGDRLMSGDGKVFLGEVTAAEYEQATVTVFDGETGEQISSPYPGHANLYITVRGTAEHSDGGYRIDGTDIFVGSEISYRVPDFSGVGKCVSMKVTEG